MLRGQRSWIFWAVVLVSATVVGLMPAARAVDKFETIHQFTGDKNGSFPRGDLTIDAEGNLYGITQDGGVEFHGIVFKLTPQANGAWAETVLHAFRGPDGAQPLDGLILDHAGNLYGTTHRGGNQDAGVVFRLRHNSNGSWTERVLHSFSDDDGANPSGPLILDHKGNIYGATSGGGIYSGGVIFRVMPNPDGSWNEKVLYNFCPGTNCSDGLFPVGRLVFDQAGNLYGTTAYGGLSCQCGVVFQLMPKPNKTWMEKVLYSFRGGNDGGNPWAGSLVFDDAGNLFGTTFGGIYEWGTVFELMPRQQGEWRKKILHSFTGGKDGNQPVAGVILDGAGNLYGTTRFGGDKSCDIGDGGCGVVFKLTPNSNGSWFETVLHRFHARPGVDPLGGVVFDAIGNLYGTTFGGFGSSGSVYEITP